MKPYYLILLTMTAVLCGLQGCNSKERKAERSEYNVIHYLINLEIRPEEKFISGYVETSIASNINGLDTLSFDLHGNFAVESVLMNNRKLPFIRGRDMIGIALEKALATSDRAKIRIHYSGQPPEAGNPPWDNGFVWSEDTEGYPWVGVTCQGLGPYVWFPSKNRLSDEPDSVDIMITVPEGLFCASNGVLLETKDLEEAGIRYHWKTSYPINNYCISINIGRYETVRRRYGDGMEMVFYVLPESRDGAAALLDEAAEMLDFYERNFGPYPFKKEKFGLVQSKYWGMEHQTINSYGNNYKKTALGYDFLMLHEMSHEWWGNLLTVEDWKDAWIHEGIGTYAEGLYIEEKYGFEEYLRFFSERAGKRITNKTPVVPRKAAEDGSFSSDIYYKGAFLIHTLRYLVGRDTLMHILNESLYRPKRRYNHINTEEWITIAEDVSGRKLSWFFTPYLYRNHLPVLEETRSDTEGGTTVHASWDINDFTMPLEAAWKHGEQVVRREKISVSSIPSSIFVPDGQELFWDPDGWVLFELKRK